MSYTVVTGGVRSGKSQFAEELAAGYERVLYVATGKAWDGEMEQRIVLHQQRRPEHWGLLEVAEQLADPLAVAEQSEWDCLLVDDLSTWVSQVLMSLPETEWRSAATREQLLQEAARLAEMLERSAGHAVVVTSETGLGGVAMSPLGRAFQDLLGEVNQIVAKRADQMYLVVSGRPLRLP